MQRFGSALNLNLHFHALVLDGVYTEDSDTGAVHWHRAPAPTDEEVAALVERIAERAEAVLARNGHGPHDEPDEDPDDAQLVIHSPQRVAAIAGRSAVRRGRRARRVQRLGGRAYQLPPKCAACDGYDVHAGVVIGAKDRKGLERLGRYIARPPLAKPRLEERPDGGVRIHFKRPWSDGTEGIDLSVVELVERLAALVPPPRANTVLYHGVLAARSALRERVRPRGRRRAQRGRAAADRLAKKPSATSRWVPWAWLLWRASSRSPGRTSTAGPVPRCDQRMRLRTVLLHSGSGPGDAGGARVAEALGAGAAGTGREAGRGLKRGSATGGEGCVSRAGRGRQDRLEGDSARLGGRRVAFVGGSSEGVVPWLGERDLPNAAYPRHRVGGVCRRFGLQGRERLEEQGFRTRNRRSKSWSIPSSPARTWVRRLRFELDVTVPVFETEAYMTGVTSGTAVSWPQLSDFTTPLPNMTGMTDYTFNPTGNTDVAIVNLTCKEKGDGDITFKIESDAVYNENHNSALVSVECFEASLPPTPSVAMITYANETEDEIDDDGKLQDSPGWGKGVGAAGAVLGGGAATVLGMVGQDENNSPSLWLSAPFDPTKQGPDGWTKQTPAGASGGFDAVAKRGDGLVAAGADAGFFLWDGVSLQPGTSPDNGSEVACDDTGVCVSSGSTNGGILRSTDGLIWTSNGGGERLSPLVFCNGVFVAFDIFNSEQLWSIDGETWTPGILSAFNVNSFACGNGIWVASAQGTTWYSSDAGKTWTQATDAVGEVTFSPTASAFFSAGYGSSGFPTIWKSVDGNAWSQTDDLGVAGAIQTIAGY